MENKEKLVQFYYEENIKRIDRNYYDTAKITTNKNIIELCKNILLDNCAVPKNFATLLQQSNEAVWFLNNCIYSSKEYWDQTFIMSLLSPYKKSDNDWWVKPFIGQAINTLISKLTSKENLNSLFEQLKKQGFDEIDIWEHIIGQGRFENFFHKENLSLLGEYLVDKIKNSKKSFLGFSLGINYKQILEYGQSNSKSEYYLKFLYNNFPDYLNENLHKLITFDSKTLSQYAASIIIEFKDKEINKQIFEYIKKNKEPYDEYLSILFNLSNFMPNECAPVIEEVYKYSLSDFKRNKNFEIWLKQKTHSYQGLSSNLIYWYLEKNNLNTVNEFIRESLTINQKIPSLLSEKLGINSLDLLVDCLKKVKEQGRYTQFNNFDVIFNELEKYDCHNIKNELWAFILKSKSKNDKISVSKIIANKTKNSFDKALELLESGKTDERIAAALILVQINSSESQKVLSEAVDTEKSDETRDIILEALSENLYSKQLSKSEIQQLIHFAEKRGKLNKLNEKWLVEDELAKIYWKEDGEVFSHTEVRFLFYRIGRAKGLNSDIEARQLINAIDKEKTIKFTKQLIKAFADTGSDTKFKHYLTTAGQLGGNEILPTINNIFRQNLADKRIKMAEYTVEALGMVGTNKALRQVEVISRKLANKRPSVSEKAKVVLEAAATELNISADELSDRIIPDFEFEGLYKSFIVDNETFRAFINTDFSLTYFDEDNKIKKTLPKGATSELKAEFKEIEKELKEVVKGQKGRLEKYLVEERRWSVEAWKSFFQEHPIMFVYARKLIWGVFDKGEKLKESFYCSDDTSLYNIEDEEVELDEGDFIGLIHPIYLDEETLKKWKDKLYEMSFVTIFPQLERKVFYVQEAEKESNVSYLFNSVDIPKGADFVSSNVEKLGWYKSTGDGGSLELTKKHLSKGITAHIYIEGVVAWYQDGNVKATVHDVSFIGKNWSDKVLLKDVPPLFYSETMADIDYLINA
jgi:hypothetical protein